MYLPEKAFEGRMLALLMLVSLINLILHFLVIHQSAEDGHWFMRSTKFSTATASIDTIPKMTVRATLVHWYGPLNYMAMEAWVKYHNERWGVTHVDIFLPDHRLDEARHVFRGKDNGVNVSVYSNRISEQLAQTDKMLRRSIHVHLLFGQALNQSRAENNNFLMNFDADEFLISDDFDTIAEMFAHAKDRKAVSIPVFNNNYGRCSSNNLTFGSTTFRSVRPIGSKFIDDPRLEYYTEPPRACGGNAKYIVTPKFFKELKSPHDPHGCIRHEATNRPPASDTTYYMTGRTTDNEHVRVVHMRTGRGLFADMTMAGCTGVRAACNYLNAHGACTDNFTEASFIHEVTSMNSILHNVPLFTGAVAFSTDAVCYAQRYPSLLEEFCQGGDVKQCWFGALGRHYDEKGKVQNLTWGCAAESPVEID